MLTCTVRSATCTWWQSTNQHDDVIKWKYFLRYGHLLAPYCERNTPVTSGFPSQRPLTRSIDVFIDLRLKKKEKTVEQTIETPMI